MEKKRQSNIELLRILAMAGVIILHYNNPVMGGGISYAKIGSLNSYILYFLDSLFACSVDLFMLISGFFLCESKKRSIWRPIELLVQVIVFREGIYLFGCIFHTNTFWFRTAIANLIPVNYFVILYCTVYLISPYINNLVERLSKRDFRVLMLLLIFLFSIFPTFVDVLGELRGEQFAGLSTVGMYGSQWGYSIVNFILMYMLGAYLRKGNSKITECKSLKLFLFLIVNISLIIIWAKVNDMIGYFTERSAWEYCNPLIICVAVILFLLFDKAKLSFCKTINVLAEGAFSVFLLHKVFLPYLNIKKFVNGNPFIMLAHIFGSVVVIYLICWCLHIIYHKISDPIFKRLSIKKTLVIEVND